MFQAKSVALPRQSAILITGASSGIGYHCAHALHKRGYRVIASCRQQADVERLRTEGLLCVQIDLRSSQSITEGFAQCLQLCEGKLAALFNNGAYGLVGAVEDLSREALREQFETNVLGWHELTCLALPHMLAQGYGRIVQNSSVLGLVAMPFRGAYVSSKFALEGLSDALRMELADTPVEVCLIEPGPILSQFRANALRVMQGNVDIAKSRFKSRYQSSIARLSKEGAAASFTLGPEAVCSALIHALESPRPKARYYVTVPTYLMAYLRRILSTRLLDKVLGGSGND